MVLQQDQIGEFLMSEFNLMFSISVVVWLMIIAYLYYTNNRVKKLEKELRMLTEE
jgi:CcmD family protein